MKIESYRCNICGQGIGEAYERECSGMCAECWAIYQRICKEAWPKETTIPVPMILSELKKLWK